MLPWNGQWVVPGTVSHPYLPATESRFGHAAMLSITATVTQWDQHSIEGPAVERNVSAIFCETIRMESWSVSRVDTCTVLPTAVTAGLPR